MSLTDRLAKGYGQCLRVIWIAAIPILIDLSKLFSNMHFLKTRYQGINDLFVIKLGIISSPPSVHYLLENFPAILYSFSTKYGISGIITEMNPFYFFLTLTIILLLSFFRSAYMGCIEMAGRENISLPKLLVMANKNWFRFFILQLIGRIPLFFIAVDGLHRVLMFVVSLVAILIYYVQYSIVVDRVSLKENFSRGVNILFDNFGLTVKMAVVYGPLLSLASILISPLSRAGMPGVITSIVMVSLLGLGVNKAVMEIYRELSVKYDSPVTDGDTC